MEVPFLRELLQTSTAAAVHLGLRLAFASASRRSRGDLRISGRSVLNPDESGFKRLKGQRLRWQLAGGLLSAWILIRVVE